MYLTRSASAIAISTAKALAIFGLKGFGIK
jgi:hypothetical protein